MTPQTIELVGAIVSATLTVLVLSYLIFGDWALYRVALHLLVGATVGYAVAVTVYEAMVRMVFPALLAGSSSPLERLGLVLPLILGMLLLLKGFPRSRLINLGNLSTAFLVGVGAAVAMGGALLGTIIPQATASGSLLAWVREGGIGAALLGLLVATGTALALLSFTFTLGQKQPAGSLVSRLSNAVRDLGRFFVLAAFGVAFATALTASLSVLIGRVYTVVKLILELLPGG